MMWAISLHYFQLQYVHSVHVNAYQQNMKRTKPANLYNGFEWDSSFHIMEEHTMWLKKFWNTEAYGMSTSHGTLKQIHWRDAKSFSLHKECLVNMQLLANPFMLHICCVNRSHISVLFSIPFHMNVLYGSTVKLKFLIFQNQFVVLL